MSKGVLIQLSKLDQTAEEAVQMLLFQVYPGLL